MEVRHFLHIRLFELKKALKTLTIPMLQNLSFIPGADLKLWDRWCGFISGLLKGLCRCLGGGIGDPTAWARACGVSTRLH